jgi:hypothetical protein
MFNTKNSRFSGNKLIILFLVMTASLFSQSWNNVVQTTIQFNTMVGLDLATNRDGNHILVNDYFYNGSHNYSLKYYLLNSSGSVIRSYTLENFQGGGGIQFANIDGANDRIYVVYKLGNQIKTRKSTNAGISWTNDSNILPINIGNNTCNHIDITFGKDDNALHVVWATQDAGSDYKTYYRRLDINNAWGTTENVTDGSNVGGFPTVSKSQNRVHVSYNTGQSEDPSTNTGEAKSRDKFTNTWQTPQLVYTPQSFRERIHAGSSKLFDFYYKLETGMGQYTSDLYVKERSLGGTYWSSPVLLKTSSTVYEIVSAANTYDGKSHIVYEVSGGVGYRSYSGSSWSSEFAVGSGYNSPRISSVSNDLFVTWGNEPTKYIRYRQYDAAPLAPQNPQLSTNPSNNRVRVSWSKNQEPDISIYEVWRKVAEMGGNWQLIGTTTNNYFVDNEYYYAPKAGDFTLTYRVRAKDIGNNFSLYSNEVTVRAEYLGKEYLAGNNTEYKLIQNYPNPFNPSTKISYSIKEVGFVTLKVYDILGVEIATLVNEQKTAGSYEADFNAANLPSGMYVYKLQSGSFTDVKKMLLTK